MNKDIKRYDLPEDDGNYHTLIIEESEDGEYVSYEDYQLLETRIEELEGDLFNESIELDLDWADS